MSSINELFRKAHNIFGNFRGGKKFCGKSGDIVYSKNNVCVHDSVNTDGRTDVDLIEHTPGYMTIQCQNHDHLGITLILQWLPNRTLEENPASIRSVSPRSRYTENSQVEQPKTTRSYEIPEMMVKIEDGEQHGYHSNIRQRLEKSAIEIDSDSDSCYSMHDTKLEMAILMTIENRQTDTETKIGSCGAHAEVTSINIIPNSPDNSHAHEIEKELVNESSSSTTTSVADESTEKDISQSDDSSREESYNEVQKEEAYIAGSENSSTQNFAVTNSCYSSSPEQFAREHNLIFEIDSDEDAKASVTVSADKAIFHQRKPSASMFSVNLGNMKSMRLFFSNSDHTSGQFVIANCDSQYKILHFHHGGLDKLADLLEQWSAVKAKSVKDPGRSFTEYKPMSDSIVLNPMKYLRKASQTFISASLQPLVGYSSPICDRQLLVCNPKLNRLDLDPEDGLYSVVESDLWKSFKNAYGQMDDSYTIRKVIYFASVDFLIRRAVWPFLLRVYPWDSTYEQRETIRNDLFLSYQKIKRRRMKQMTGARQAFWNNIEHSITKDVVRTDRRNPFYASDCNPNSETLKNILLNYAAANQRIGYIQGMSDLLAPILWTLRDETNTYWCFCGWMQQTLFAAASNEDGLNAMELNLMHLRELLELLVSDFFRYLVNLGGDTLQLMFTHRWILLWFKREFCEFDVLKIWEACWVEYRTTYFHLFICIAIVSIYGNDVIEQKLLHDEILFYFNSLSMHMNADIVLKKARGFLYKFYRLEKLPCSLAPICMREDVEQWASHTSQRTFECVRIHGNNEACPFINN